MRRSTHAAIIALVLLASGSLIGSHVVSAHVDQTTIDPMATRAIGGSYAVVSGTISCTSGEFFQVNLVLGQSATGAQARGSAAGTCTDRSVDWTITALTRLDSPLLQPGLARVCWSAATSLFGQMTDSRQRCNTVTLSDPALVAFPHEAGS